MQANRDAKLSEALRLFGSIVSGDEINQEFETYLIDTAVSIRYSGVLASLIHNEKKEVSTKGFKPILVNSLVLKMLKTCFAYPEYFQYGSCKDIFKNPYREAVLKHQTLDILDALKCAIRTYQLTANHDVMEKATESNKNAYNLLLQDNSLGSMEFHASDANGSFDKKPNMRLAYFSYFETDSGYQSRLDAFGLKTANSCLEDVINSLYYKTLFNYSGSELPIPKGSMFHSFKLVVDKRGLLIGTGYPHMNLRDNGDSSDFQLGLFFDWTTGVPIIPASSIKGFLLASFRNNEKDTVITSRFNTLCNKVGIPELTAEDISCLAEHTFGSSKKQAKGNVFFNAFITGRSALKHESENSDYVKYIDEDWLAPHLHEKTRSRLCEPIPIRFLKIAPGVTFQFNFILKDSVLGSGQNLTSAQITELFKSILLSRTFGAKHRTGFGRFVEVMNPN